MSYTPQLTPQMIPGWRQYVIIPVKVTPPITRPINSAYPGAPQREDESLGEGHDKGGVRYGAMGAL